MANHDTRVVDLILDPRYRHVNMLVKAFRNGIVYGVKMRFPHALVLTFLYHPGTLRHRCSRILRATHEHAGRLGLYVVLYKALMLLLRYSQQGQQGCTDAFWAGLLGGYAVFGRKHSAIREQIVLYVFTRTALALARLVGSMPRRRGWHRAYALQDGVQKHAWPLFAASMWAAIMYLYRWHPQHLTPSSWTQMDYLFAQSERWDSLETLLLRSTR